jgi:hypothetical protein
LTTKSWERIPSAAVLRDEAGRFLPHFVGAFSCAEVSADRRNLDGLRNRTGLCDFTIEQFLEWADSHYSATGRWPSQHSGDIAASVGEKWCAVDTALAQGHRGLAGGSSLAKILDRHRRKPARRPK